MMKVEVFTHFADVYRFHGSNGQLVARFHSEQYRRAFIKKAMKLARKVARKSGGLRVEKLIHKEKEKAA